MLGRRVVISGMGTVNPVGMNVGEFCSALKEGRSGLKPIQRFDTKNFPVKNAFEIQNFSAHKYGTQVLDPFIQYAIAATSEALISARFQASVVDPYRVGISVSSSKGGVHTVERFKDRFSAHPSAILGARVYTNSVPNFAAQWVARRWKVKGPAKCYVAACATGTVAVIEGARMVSEGIVDYCIAGASDASIVPLMLAGYHQMKALAKDRMRPFDRRREGFQVGEGAGIVFLETPETAKARRAEIFGEIAGYGAGSDSHDAVHFDEKDDALARTFAMVLSQMNGNDGKPDYLNLHGTGTRTGDLYETNQIKKALGKKAYEIPMSSTKSMTGHMLGASGTVEIIATLLAMKHGFVPPTVGYEERDKDCDLDYTPERSREQKINSAVSLSMGFGGHIAAIGLKKV